MPYETLPFVISSINLVWIGATPIPLWNISVISVKRNLFSMKAITDICVRSVFLLPAFPFHVSFFSNTER